MADDSEGGQTPLSGPARALIVVVVLLALVAVFLMKSNTSTKTPTSLPTAGRARSLTATRNDAVGDFAKAKKSGKPIYVLFHSLS